MDFAISFIMDNISTIIIRDIKLNVVGSFELFWTDKDIIKKILQDLLGKRKEAIDSKRGLSGNTTTQLT